MENLRQRIAAFREFNRFYTGQIGLLNRGLLHTPFPLTQARILFEIAQKKNTTASALIQELDIDRGYLSRILSSFESEGLIRKTPSKTDSRQQILQLSAAGRKAFAVLNERSTEEAKKILTSLPDQDQTKLLRAMRRIENILGKRSGQSISFLIRTHRPGDLGWVAHRHGVVYSEEYSWDQSFETLVAEILVNFMKNHDPQRERLWIAEQNGEPAGSVMIVDAGEKISQLRLLLVEREMRGRGLGKRLVQECIEFSRDAGYRKMKLWTQSLLNEARQLYSVFGFKIVEQMPHHSFGHDLIAEIWELPLE